MTRLILAAMLLLAAALARADYDQAVQSYAQGNYPEAMAEFKQLAANGDAKAMYYVGFLYYRGYGVPVDHTQAASWFRRAAEQGDSQAQYYLGLMAQNGQGMQRDPVAAYASLSLSAKNAPSARDAAYTREEIKKLERKMTPQQIAEAKDLASRGTPQNQ